MFTQVRSFSQLKYDLRDVNTFVLEPDDDDPLVRTRSFHGVRGLEDGEETNDASSAKVLSRSESAPSLEGGLTDECDARMLYNEVCFRDSLNF
ncbi:hypothetical protein HPB52_025608 [Rhipicephalus sanguineus]|uniref:Uncharacterized protein n=1 Tax=Rhipicephalus sanguineus TaxID=34632 RepID=A0A9D4TCV3_RHISA|nr:hypothetical protein HPB52_025608 [Rhipicephalus sanguineus]